MTARRAGSCVSAAAVYGFYLDKEQALLDALDAARDASETGREAQVWICDSAETARIF